MKIIDVEIKGISPLLQHRYVFKDEIEESIKKRSGTVDYSNEWIKSLYWSEDVGVYQPAQIEIHDEQISPEAIKAVLDYAGNFCGIGDFRPRYGRFLVSSFH